MKYTKKTLVNIRNKPFLAPLSIYIVLFVYTCIYILVIRLKIFFIIIYIETDVFQSLKTF